MKPSAWPSPPIRCSPSEDDRSSIGTDLVKLRCLRLLRAVRHTANSSRHPDCPGRGRTTRAAQAPIRHSPCTLGLGLQHPEWKRLKVAEQADHPFRGLPPEDRPAAPWGLGFSIVLKEIGLAPATPPPLPLAPVRSGLVVAECTSQSPAATQARPYDGPAPNYHTTHPTKSGAQQPLRTGPGEVLVAMPVPTV